MKWQRQSFSDKFDVNWSVDLTTIPLEELYRMQANVEKHIEDLRASEPSSKRKNTRQHDVWFDTCQGAIERLHEIRDAIIAVTSKDRI